MQDTQLYQRILGLEEPWYVSRVELNLEKKQVDLWVEHRPATWHCPVCQQAVGLYDHSEERVWRHLDTCQFQTLLHARVPRTGCPVHGIHKVKLPWAETRSRFTLLMERLIIDVLLQCQTLSGACAIVQISWDEAQGIMQRAVERGQQRKEAAVVQQIGVDEKAFAKGHRYVTLVSDLQRGTVQYVAEDRTAPSLAGYFAALTPAQRQGIEAVAMDMWRPYVQAVREGLAEGESKIVFDRFHIMKQMNEAVDKVRRAEHRELRQEGCDWLSGSKYWWLYGRENLPERYRGEFRQLQQRNLRTGRAWAIKETLRGLWAYQSETWARKFFDRWFGWAKRSRLSAVKKVADMLRTHLAHVLSYCRHRITNGVAEGLNSKIMTIKRKCCGFANMENFKTAIYFHCGGLDLYPR